MYFTGYSLLCHRVGRVCRLWHSAASSPGLWHKVTLGHCWIAPGRSQLPKTEQKIKDTINWLAQNRSVCLLSVQEEWARSCRAHVRLRIHQKLFSLFLFRFSLLRDFSLFHWKKNVNYAVDVSHSLSVLGYFILLFSNKFMCHLNTNIKISRNLFHCLLFQSCGSIFILTPWLDDLSSLVTVIHSLLFLPSWLPLGCGAVLSPSSLPNHFQLHRPVSKCLQHPRAAQLVFAKHKSAIFWGILYSC